MTRKLFAFAIMWLVLCAVYTCAAAEQKVPSTPTDLGCAHEHRKTTIYFFDSPAYEALGEESHKVSGPADIETVCLDCGEVLSSRTTDYAEEIRPHSMKNGVCVLCGFHREVQAEPVSRPAGRSEEQTLYARQDTSVKDLQTLTLSSEDLSAVKASGASVLLIRGENGSAAIALGVADILAQAEAEDADLYLELAEREDSSLFAGLYLVSASGERRELSGDGVTLRLYQENRPGIRASVVTADSDMLVETEVEWDGNGYWTIQYLEEGTYFILQ